jgi:hypothetical protein
MAASGEVSVIPQAWTMCMPWSCSKRCMSDSGTADPPHATRRSDVRSVGCSSTHESRSFQIVGTAPATVGRSSEIMRASGSACRKRPGRTKSAPASQPE